MLFVNEVGTMRTSTKIKVSLSILVLVAALFIPFYYYEIKGEIDLKLFNTMWNLIPIYTTYIVSIVLRDRNISRFDNKITNNVFAQNRKCRKELIDIIDSYYSKCYLSAARRLELLQKECETNKELAAILTFKGICFLGKKGNNHAVKAFSEAVKLDENNSYTWSNYGFASWQIGYYEDAKEMLEQAVLLDDDNACAHSNLACFHLYSKEMTDALEHLGIALSIENHRNDAIALMALCKAFQGDFTEAKRYRKLYKGKRANKRLLRKWVREIKKKGFGIEDADCLSNWTAEKLGSFREAI